MKFVYPKRLSVKCHHAPLQERKSVLIYNTLRNTHQILGGSSWHIFVFNLAVTAPGYLMPFPATTSRNEKGVSTIFWRTLTIYIRLQSSVETAIPRVRDHTIFFHGNEGLSLSGISAPTYLLIWSQKVCNESLVTTTCALIERKAVVVLYTLEKRRSTEIMRTGIRIGRLLFLKNMTHLKEN